MPTKRNKAGNQQNYVPKGNGDASGEYGDNATGSNKHFQTFQRGGENKVDNAEKKFNQTPNQKTKTIRKVIDEYGFTTYYDESDWKYLQNVIKSNPEQYERKIRQGWKFETYDLAYNEDKIKQDFKDYLEKQIEDGKYKNSFRSVADYKSTLNEEDKDAFYTVYEENEKEFSDFIQEAKEKVEEKNRKKSIIEGEEEVKKFPKIQGDVSIDKNIELVNKNNYDKSWNGDDYNKYHKNCQKCVQAFELRMRGYDVEATEYANKYTDDWYFLDDIGWDIAMYVEDSKGIEYYGNDWFSGKKNKLPKIQNKLVKSNSVKQRDDISRIVSDAGDGARFQCAVAWKNGGGHIFNIINDKGKVRFIDAQSGDLDVSRYFDVGMIMPSRTMLMRVDNLKLNKYVSKVAKGKENDNKRN